MSIDRIKGPAIQSIKKIDLIQAEKAKLDNGIPFYQVKSGTQPVIRLEFIFEAGIRQQQKPLVASFSNSMLVEGTKKLSAQAIAEKFDYFGAFVEPEIDNDRAGLTLHCLSKSFNSVFPQFAELLLEASYPENILKTNLSNSRQKYIVNTDKVEFLARKKFMQVLFGETHPYGRQAELENFDDLKQADLLDFYSQFYQLNNLTIVASGQYGEEVFQLVNQFFGTIKITERKNNSFTHSEEQKIQKLKIEKKGAVQNSIRIGSQFPIKSHPDFFNMQILNTALGGYFGSRLMANIREDKGYTYGIGSGVVSMEKAGYFFIATEVGSDVCEKALKEIYFETTKLCNEEIGNEELNMVKNYMLGSFLRHSDGPFAMADRFKAIHFYQLDYTHFDNYIDAINTVSARDLLNVAQKYLNQDRLSEVITGTF